MTELVIVFDDMTSRPKIGTLYIDNIFVSRPKEISRSESKKQKKLIEEKLKTQVKKTEKGLVINLKETINFSFVILRNSPLHLLAFSNANWAGCPDT